MRAAGRRRAPSRLVQIGTSGRRRAASAAACAQRLDRGRHVAGVEGAGDLQRDDAGPGRRARPRAPASASSAPATTIWPPPLKLAGVRSELVESRERRSASSPPRRRSCRSASTAAASAIAAAAVARRDAGVRFGQDAGGGGGGELADRVAGDAGDRVAAAVGEQRCQASRLGRDDQRLGDLRCRGWCRHPSRCRAATRSTPAASRVAREVVARRRGVSSQGARKPGVWEPCPGQTTTITYPVLPIDRGVRLAISSQESPRSLCASRTGQRAVAACRRRPSAGRRRCRSSRG